jgi:hypothetical protein
MQPLARQLHLSILNSIVYDFHYCEAANPTMSSSKLICSTLIVLAVVCGVVLASLSATPVNVESTGNHSFTIDEPMERVRKILVRTNAVKKIVAMAQARLVDQQWLNAQIQLGDRPIMRDEWQVKSEGELVVETTHYWLGKHEITLEQRVQITPQRLQVSSQLNEPKGPIRKYQSTLLLTPDGNGDAHFDTSLQLRIETSSNWLTSAIVKSEIRQAAKKSLQNQEQAIREIVNEYSDDLFILPKSRDK